MLKGPELIPNGDVKQLVVLLHGYGASGDDLIELAYPWQNYLVNTAFFAPNAPRKYPGGIFGYEWFDLSNDSDTNIKEGLASSRGIVTEYLKSCLARFELTADKLVLVGFSQGTMVALDQIYSMLDFAGIVGFSGAFYPQQATVKSSPSVLLVHGTVDNVVPFEAMNNAKFELESLGLSVTTVKCQGLGHGIDPQGSFEGISFISEILTKSKLLVTTSSVI